MLKVEWEDFGREPKCRPNPNFPNGMDVDSSEGAAKTCSCALPYPAKRCGAYIVRCDACGMSTAITTAGRPDDPKSVKLACFEHKLHPGMTKITVGPFNAPDSNR